MDSNTTEGSSADPVAVAIRSLRTMATGGRSDFDVVFHPDAVNREDKVQPPSSRVAGPAGFHAGVAVPYDVSEPPSPNVTLWMGSKA